MNHDTGGCRELNVATASVMRNGLLTNRFNLRKRTTNRDSTEDDLDNISEWDKKKGVSEK